MQCSLQIRGARYETIRPGVFGWQLPSGAVDVKITCSCCYRASTQSVGRTVVHLRSLSTWVISGVVTRDAFRFVQWNARPVRWREALRDAERSVRRHFSRPNVVDRRFAADWTWPCLNCPVRHGRHDFYFARSALPACWQCSAQQAIQVYSSLYWAAYALSSQRAQASILSSVEHSFPFFKILSDSCNLAGKIFAY